MRERFTSHRGRQLRYLQGGRGPAMLLCHGFLGSAENFETWFPALSERRTMVVPDLPGCGRSAPLQDGHSVEALAGAALAAADHAGLDRFDLAGLCLGASVAQCLLRQRPEAVGRLVLHTPLLAPGMVRRRFHLQVALLTAPGVFPAVSWLSRRRLVSDLYKRLMVEGRQVEPQAAQQNFENQVRAVPRAAREWLRDGLRRDDLAALAARRGPTLIMVAREDRIVDVPALEAAVAGLPEVRLAVIEAAGHGWTRAYVERQLALLRHFLD